MDKPRGCNPHDRAVGCTPIGQLSKFANPYRVLPPFQCQNDVLCGAARIARVVLGPVPRPVQQRLPRAVHRQVAACTDNGFRHLDHLRGVVRDFPHKVVG